jgi:positive regulator of sigma E activity
VPDITHTESEAEIGVVTALQGDDAIVEIMEQEICETCGARLVCRPDKTGKRTLRAINSVGAKIGNEVCITEKSNILLKMSFFQYGLPFLGFMAGIFLLYATNLSMIPLPKELLLFLGGIAGLVISAFISRYYVKKLAEGNAHFFEITRILSGFKPNPYHLQ